MPKGLQFLRQSAPNTDIVKALCLIRFRVLEPDIDNYCYTTIADCAKFVGISYQSAGRLIYEKIQSNSALKRPKVRQSRHQRNSKILKIGKRRKLNSDMIASIIDPKNIIDWASKTLDERAVMLHRLHPQVKITGSRLGQIYKKYKVKRKAITMQKLMSKQFKGKINKRIQEAKDDLEHELLQGTQVYYLDECMFTTQTYQKRDFAPKGQNVVLANSQQNIQSTALIAAIGLNVGVVHYELWKRSINGDSFMHFLRNLKRKHGKKHMVIYMDNLKVHLRKDVVELYDELDITPIMAPPYSPKYNPIEFFFGMLKHKVKKCRLSDMLKRKQRKYDVLVPKAIGEVEKQKINNCIQHVYHNFKINVQVN